MGSWVLRIERVAVVGAGNMGSGIAQKIATEGYPVILVDMDESLVNRGMERLRNSVDEAVTRRIFTADRAAEILSLVTPKTNLDAAGQADLVIETVFEDLAVKRDLFARLDQLCKPETILATNTSSFCVGDLGRSTQRADRFIGLHYFYHPAKNRLVEVIPAEETAPEVFELAWRFQEVIGKTPIRSADAPGFIVNRYFVPWLNEAVRLVEEDVADIPTVEAVARRCFAIGMGPFELMNVTGIPIAFHAATTLGDELGAFYAPADMLRAQVERGKPWPLEGEVRPGREAAVADRLLAVTFQVAGELIDEGICTKEDCDIGARVGLRWALGPFELMNREGIARAVNLVSQYAAANGLSVPGVLTEQKRRGESYRLATVRRSVNDRVATITINRPDALNALNEEVVTQLGEAVRAAIDDPDVHGIVITGAGKAFMAGADLKFFIRNMERGDLVAIRRFTERAQALLATIDGSPKTVVCQMNGLALGGGFELALACDYIVAAERAAIAFPETGIGIYPGLGGTQRTRQRVGREITKYLVYGGEMIAARTAGELGLVDQVVPPADLEAVARGIALGHPPVQERQVAVPGERWREIADFCARESIQSILSGAASGGGEALDRFVRRVRGKAPLALCYAEEIIDGGAGLPLNEGLALELSHLEEVFQSEDALEGMRAVASGEKASFKGR